MGQYYSAVVAMNGKVTGFRSQNPGALKLTEHSWWYNGFVNHISKNIFTEPHKVAWVGDYARSIAPCSDEMYQAAHENELVRVPDEEEFTPEDLFLVNWDKKEYLDCSKYYAAVDGKSHLGCGWVLHPLPLLTAIGNGQGGGDYFGDHRENVGVWAWNTLSFETEPPAGYTEVNYRFYD